MICILNEILTNNFVGSQECSNNADVGFWILLLCYISTYKGMKIWPLIFFLTLICSIVEKHVFSYVWLMSKSALHSVLKYFN